MTHLVIVTQKAKDDLRHYYRIALSMLPRRPLAGSAGLRRHFKHFPQVLRVVRWRRKTTWLPQ